MAALSPGRLVDRLLYGVLGHVPRTRPFVFGIGLSKTGTTSLNDALKILGYHAFHLPPITRVQDGTIRMDIPWWVYRYDALTDLSVAAVHRELAAAFPNARFIYTRRELPKWLGSCEKHFTQALTERRIAQGQRHLIDLSTTFYGSRLFDAAKFSEAYARHEADVLALHGGKANFLAYDLTAGEGWKPLCDFLDKPRPDRPFPMSNRAAATG
jgi:hypothetical protein